MIPVRRSLIEAKASAIPEYGDAARRMGRWEAKHVWFSREAYAAMATGRYDAALSPPAKAEPGRPKRWPLAARVIARRRRPGEIGVGDTLARIIAAGGGGTLKRWYKTITGRDCKCGNRQARLNARFPYPP